MLQQHENFTTGFDATAVGQAYVHQDDIRGSQTLTDVLQAMPCTAFMVIRLGTTTVVRHPYPNQVLFTQDSQIDCCGVAMANYIGHAVVQR